MSSSDLSICVPEKNRTVGPWGFQTPFQTNHPEFGAGEAPPNFPVKETGFAFCTFRSPKTKPSRKLPTSGMVVFLSKTHAIATTNQHRTVWRWHGTWDKIQAQEVGTGFRQLPRVRKYHMCVEKKRTPIVLGINSSHPLEIRNFLTSRALYAPILSFGLMSLSPIYIGNHRSWSTPSTYGTSTEANEAKSERSSFE